MKNLLSKLLFFAILFSYSQELKKRQITADQVDTVFSQWNTKDKPGIAVGVLNDGEIVYNKGFGMANLGVMGLNGHKNQNFSKEIRFPLENVHKYSGIPEHPLGHHNYDRILSPILICYKFQSLKCVGLKTMQKGHKSSNKI